MGSVYLWQKHYEPTIAETERAVVLAPNEAETSAALAKVLSCVGKTEETLEAAAQALRLQPLLAEEHLGVHQKPGDVMYTSRSGKIGTSWLFEPR